jgi:hypothetical protein
MKKAIIYSFTLWLSIIGLFAETPLTTQPPFLSTELALPNTDSFVEIECTIEPISPPAALRKQYHRQSFGTKPSQPIVQGTSTNWSGYVAALNLLQPTVGSVNAVFGVWAVPTLSPSVGHTYSSAWVGIDGYGNGTVEQIGTEHEWYNGAQHDFAWFEMYPNPMYRIVGFPVNQGDLIGAQVYYAGANTFQLRIYNYTKGVSTLVPTVYTTSAVAQRSTVEWIVEAPSSYQGVLPLAHFNSISFIYCLATMNGITGSIGSGYWQYDPLFMTTPNGVFKAIPTGLSGGGQNFSIFWQHE